jgi:dUTP pyrophosphatase
VEQEAEQMTVRPVEFMVLPHGEGLPQPRYQSDGSAGLDLHAAVHQPLRIAPGARALVPTGIAIALPPDLEAQVRPRSGLALKHGVTVLNSPGTIDSDYRGEVGVLLINLGQDEFVVSRGDRIAQLVIATFVQIELALVSGLFQTDRNQGGFGSTGQ